jgi:dTDP-glucose pyrophosphorylase
MEGVILAAGKGTRMRPYSNAVNKEMSLIGPYPVIEYCVRALASCGVKQAYVVLSEGKDQVFEYLRSGSDFGVDIAYLYQDMNKGKGTAKAVAAVEPWTRDSFMLVYGDSFFYPTNFISEIADYHIEQSADVTMGVYMMSEHKDYGIMSMQGYDIVDILEKASDAEASQLTTDGKYPINSGPIVFGRSIFEYIRRTEVSPLGEYWLTDSIRLMIKEKRKVIGFPIPNSVFWRDIGRMDHRIEAERYIQKILETNGSNNLKKQG